MLKHEASDKFFRSIFNKLEELEKRIESLEKKFKE